jgi:autotransporter adhesin
MNKIYSLVWNRSRNRIDVASELASGRRGGAASSSGRIFPSMTALASAVALSGAILFPAPAAAASLPVSATRTCAAQAQAEAANACSNDPAQDHEVALGIEVVQADDGADDTLAIPIEPSQAETSFSAAGLPLASVAAFAAQPMVLPPGAPQRPPPSGSVPSGLMIGTGGLVGNVGGALNPTLTSLFNPNSAYLQSGNLQLASANVTQTFVTTQVLGLTVLNLTPAGTAVNGTLLGYDQRLTLLGGATSGSYITNVNKGTDGFYSGVAGLVLPNGAPAWADTCANILGLLTAPCWAVNAAQNNQVIIGDGASANGSEEVVIGTGASHTLASVDANTVFPGDGNRNSATDPMGVPDSDYQSRLGHSVVIGDSASGTQNMQTILGANATSDQVNSVALGYGSDADRGPLSGYTNAPGLIGIPQDSAGEVAVGKTGYNRQITHVAAGTDDYDAVNVLQLEGAVSAATTDAVIYDDASHTSVTLGGAGAAAPVALTNVASGIVAAGSTDAVNGDQLYTVQQIANNANQGWNVTTGATGTGVANGPIVANVAPGSTATLLADNNIITTQAGAAVAIGVNPVLTGLTSIAFTTGGPVITGGGIDMGDTRITNLAPAQDATDAVTLEQMGSAVADATANAVTYDDATHATVTLGGAGAATPVVLTNVADGSVAADSADAVNGSQLYAVQQLANNANQGWNVTTAATGTGIVNGTTIANIAPGGTTTLLADNNIIATQTGAAVAFGVNPVLTGLTSIAFTTGGPVISGDGIDMGNTRVTDMAEAQTDSDAVTLGQMNAAIAASGGDLHYFSVNDGGTQGGNYANDGASGTDAVAIGADALADGDASTALGFDANTAGFASSVALGAGSTVDRANSVSVGAPGAERQITNVAAASQPTDAVNLAQVDALTNDGAAALTSHYFKANGPADGSDDAWATGARSVAAGPDAGAAGDFSVALGAGALTPTRRAIAIGQNASASGAQGFALGTYAVASGNNSVALGGAIDLNANGIVDGNENTVATGGLSMALGVNSRATATNASAVGAQAQASGTGSTAAGSNAIAAGTGSAAVGFGAEGNGYGSVALGWNAAAAGQQGIAEGHGASAAGDFSVALGVGSYSPTRRAIAIGQSSVASGAQAFALGSYASAQGANSVALGGAIDLNGDGRVETGENTVATGGLSMALGVNSQATAGNASAIGSQAMASGLGSTAVGSNASTSGTGAAALGFGASASADNSVAIGWNSIADVANTVSVGSAGNYRRIVNVADPTGAHDAVTLGYLQSNYSTSDALASLSQQIDALNKQMAGLTRASSTQSAAAPAVASDSPVPAAASGQTQQAVVSANAYTDQQTQEALQSANTYAQAQGTQAVSAAKAYTDAALANYVTTDTFNQYQQQVNARFSQQDERIDRTSAMSTAMVQMAASAAGIDTPNRIGIGVGSTHGESALAVGYQRAIGKNATFTIGGSASSGESTVGAGVGFGW